MVSYLYAVFSIIVGLLILGEPRTGRGLYDSRTFAVLMILHGTLLAAAGQGLRSSRPWAAALTLLAAAGALFFAVLDARKANWVNAGLDALYVLLVVAILLRTRHHGRQTPDPGPSGNS